MHLRSMKHRLMLALSLVLFPALGCGFEGPPDFGHESFESVDTGLAPPSEDADDLEPVDVG